jgi:heparanase 1
MRKLAGIIASLATGWLVIGLTGISLFLFTSRAGWLWLLPAGLLGSLGVLIALGLRGSRGGLVALVRGQWAPHPGQIPHRVHCSPASLALATTAEVIVDLSQPAARISERFLSVAIDLSQVVGGKWWDPAADHVEASSGSLKSPVFDFDRPRLDRLLSALSPLYLRAGGSESDKIFYSLDDEVTPLPGYQSVLTQRQWDALHAFCDRNGCDLVFTLNAGPSSRRPGGAWNPDNAAALMQYTAAQGQQVYAWELGNELNVYFFVHGLRHLVDVAQYCHDLQCLHALRDRYAPSSRLAGQGSAYVPVLGEMLGTFFGFEEQMLKQAGGLIDCVTWHYYPQQSRRCPMGTRRAHSARLLDPYNLDEAAYWAAQVNKLRDRYAPGLPVWLGETGNAQCGGEPGLSDTYLAGLWWLDELGLMARLGQQVVVRQSLTGMNYGLLDEATLEPRPDYWNSLLWKALMGQTSYPVRVNGPRTLRAYLHSCPGVDDMTLLAINLDPQRPVVIQLPQFTGQAYEKYALTSPDVLSGQVWLNGHKLCLNPQGQLPIWTGMDLQPGERIQLPPLSYSFLKFHL